MGDLEVELQKMDHYQLLLRVLSDSNSLLYETRKRMFMARKISQ
jgi:hypothetical protein